MISKSWNLHMNENLITTGLQRYQNCQISIYILRVIDLASQLPNSDWKWTLVGWTSNWGVKY